MDALVSQISVSDVSWTRIIKCVPIEAAVLTLAIKALVGDGNEEWAFELGLIVLLVLPFYLWSVRKIRYPFQIVYMMIAYIGWLLLFETEGADLFLEDWTHETAGFQQNIIAIVVGVAIFQFVVPLKIPAPE